MECRASPPDPISCIDELGLGRPYAYLLGIYLGDGMLTLTRRGVWKLRVTLDVKYPGIIQRTCDAIQEVGARRSGQVLRPGCVEVYSHWKHWICVFPQHGPGPKHARPITLESWQRRLVRQDPDAFIAGLIHSDGCRFINRVKGHEYPRYMFSNTSPDIRELFVQACAMIGVDARPAGSRNISVARRGSVEILDRVVGPKR